MFGLEEVDIAQIAYQRLTNDFGKQTAIFTKVDNYAFMSSILFAAW